MAKQIFISSIVFIFLYSLNLCAVDYYVASDGNDGNTGISPDSPWKTLYKIRQQDINPGDTINLKRGSVWNCDDNERLYFNTVDTGSRDLPILVRPYGNGNLRPVLNAIQVFPNSNDITQWEADGADKWYLCDNYGTARLWFDGIEKREAFNINEVNSETPWFYDQNTERLYVYCQGQNPAEAGIELLATWASSPVALNTGNSHIQIRGLEIHGGCRSGQISIIGGCNIIVEECVLLKSGGNGIRITGNIYGYPNATEIVIRNNIIDAQINLGEYDYELYASHDGIALNSGSYCLIYGNTLRDFTHTVLDLATYYDDVNIIENCEVFDNIVSNTNISYGRAMAVSGTNVRYNKVYRNIFINCDTRSQLGGGHHNDIYENIFDCSCENGTKSYQTAQGLLISAYKGPIHNNRVYNNTFYNLECQGIYIAGKSVDDEIYSNEIANNIIFNCGRESNYIGLQIDHYAAKVNNNIYKNNIVYNDVLDSVISYNSNIMTVAVWNQVIPVNNELILDNLSLSPELIDPVKSIFGLQASSNAIASGAAGYAFEDIGAKENNGVNGLILFYNFNEGNGSDIFDKSVNGINASFSTPSWLQSGYSGRTSAEFTGNNFVSTEELSSSQYFTDKMTFMAVINLNNNLLEQCLVEMEQVFSLTVTSDSKLRFCAYNCSGISSCVLSQAVVTPGEQHVSVSVNGKNVTFFRNGVLCGSGQLATSFDVFNNQNKNILFGNNSNGNSSFIGSMDEVRIYNTSLGANEISRAYKSSTAFGIIIHYKCDNNAYDSSGNNIHGVIAPGTGYASSAGYIKQALSMAYPSPNEYIETQDDVQTETYFCRDFSFCAWVYFTGDSLYENACLLDKAGTFCIFIGHLTGKVYLYSYDSQGKLSDSGISTDSSVLAYNKWMHIAVVQHGTNVVFYKNGQVIKVEEISKFDRFFDNNNKIRFGCSSSGNFQMIGRMDEIKVFNRALTIQEVINNM